MNQISVAVALLLLMPTPALAWANGPNGYNAYGAHDWILDKAIQSVDPEWVKVCVALRATDDPDCKDGIDHNAKVHRITKRQLKRAANALADLIGALDS